MAHQVLHLFICQDIGQLLDLVTKAVYKDYKIKRYLNLRGRRRIWYCCHSWFRLTVENGKGVDGNAENKHSAPHQARPSCACNSPVSST